MRLTAIPRRRAILAALALAALALAAGPAAAAPSATISTLPDVVPLGTSISARVTGLPRSARAWVEIATADGAVIRRGLARRGTGSPITLSVAYDERAQMQARWRIQPTTATQGRLFARVRTQAGVTLTQVSRDFTTPPWSIFDSQTDVVPTPRDVPHLDPLSVEVKQVAGVTGTPNVVIGVDGCTRKPEIRFANVAVSGTTRTFTMGPAALANLWDRTERCAARFAASSRRAFLVATWPNGDGRPGYRIYAFVTLRLPAPTGGPLASLAASLTSGGSRVAIDATDIPAGTGLTLEARDSCGGTLASTEHWRRVSVLDGPLASVRKTFDPAPIIAAGRQQCANRNALVFGTVRLDVWLFDDIGALAQTSIDVPITTPAITVTRGGIKLRNAWAARLKNVSGNGWVRWQFRAKCPALGQVVAKTLAERGGLVVSKSTVNGPSLLRFLRRCTKPGHRTVTGTLAAYDRDTGTRIARKSRVRLSR